MISEGKVLLHGYYCAFHWWKKLVAMKLFIRIPPLKAICCCCCCCCCVTAFAYTTGKGNVSLCNYLRIPAGVANVLLHGRFAYSNGEGNVLLRDCFCVCHWWRQRVVAWLFCVYHWWRQRVVAWPCCVFHWWRKRVLAWLFLRIPLVKATPCCVTVFAYTAGRLAYISFLVSSKRESHRSVLDTALTSRTARFAGFCRVASGIHRNWLCPLNKRVWKKSIKQKSWN